MVGTTISHYKVLEKIGQGSMGEVYRAEDTNLSREVAIWLESIGQTEPNRFRPWFRRALTLKRHRKPVKSGKTLPSFLLGHPF